MGAGCVYDQVAQGMPTAVTVASKSDTVAARVQALLSTPRFRCYRTTDVEGETNTIPRLPCPPPLPPTAIHLFTFRVSNAYQRPRPDCRRSIAGKQQSLLAALCDTASLLSCTMLLPHVRFS